MSSREICDELGLSKSSISNALQIIISSEIVSPTKDVPERYGIREKISMKQALILLDRVSIGRHSREPKQKLTLAISKDVIESARYHGINISAITEEFLKAVMYDYFQRAHSSSSGLSSTFRGYHARRGKVQSGG